MEIFRTGGTSKTPKVLFDAESGDFKIEGRSIPENSIEFYKPLMDWMDEYATKPNNNTTVFIKLEYFNTSSSKCILDIFKKMERIKINGFEVSIVWHYEQDDEDMFEAGEDYQSIIDIPFNFVEIKE